MSHYYEITVDHYSGPTRKECCLKREVKPLVKKIKASIFGGIGYVRVDKITTVDVTKEFE